MTIPLLILVLFLAWLVTFVWDRLSTRRGARRLLGDLEILNQSEHEYRETSLERFPHLDHAYYRRVTEALTALGFRLLGDVENVTLNSARISLPTASRTLVSGDGRTLAGIYCVKMGGLGGLLLRLRRRNPARNLDLVTPLDDGRFLCTSNARLEAMDWPPELGVELAPSAEPATLWTRHRDRLAELERADPPIRGLVTSTLAEALQSQARMHEVRVRFRRSRPGFVSGEEMERIGRPGLRRPARQLHAEMLRQQQAGSEGTPPTAGGDDEQ